MSTLTVTIGLDETTVIQVGTDPRYPPDVRIGNDVWIRPDYGVDEVAVADSLLAAVTEWHGEVHRRAAERAEAGR